MPVQQQQDDQPAAAPAAWAGDGGGEGAHDLPSLRRPLLPCPEAQGAQAQVTLPSSSPIQQPNNQKFGEKWDFDLLDSLWALMCPGMWACREVFTEDPMITM